MCRSHAGRSHQPLSGKSTECLSPQDILAIGPSLGLKVLEEPLPYEPELSPPRFLPGPMLKPPRGMGPGFLGSRPGWPRKPCPISPNSSLPPSPPSSPLPPSPHTHSLFSVKNHKVLLDRIKAVLKVVILLLVRTSAGCHQVLSHPLRWEHFHLVCLSSHDCPSGFLPKPKLYAQAAEHLGVCTSQVTLSQ